MENKIKITKDLKFDFDDLMREVDVDCEFTLRDILRSAINSEISPIVLSQILRCNYVKDYWEEAESRKFEQTEGIEYLELYMWGEIEECKGKRITYNGWGFDGVGKEDDVPDDLVKWSKENNKEIKKGFRQKYALEFSPLYHLADYPIKISDKILVKQTGESEDGKYLWEEEEYYFRPTITLIDLLHTIFWELSFFGSPKKRDEQKEELDQRCEEIDKAKKEGRLDEIMIPWEKVKGKLEQKIEELDKNIEEDR